MRKLISLGVVIIVAGVLFSGCKLGKAKDEQKPVAESTPKPKVNLIDIKERPYVSLQPLQSRNELQFVISNLPKKASSVEVILEYDRNKGVLDAVLKNFSLPAIPYADKLFMGSKSSGGHITFHEDVIGGTLTLNFTGPENYSVQVPWRYDDTQPHYTQVATADQKFQMVLDKPFRTPKIVIMQSPGLPSPVDGTLVAGPYLIRGVGPLPVMDAKLTIHLPQTEEGYKLMGFNGQKWQQFDSVLEGRTLTATVPLVETYVVIQ